MAPGAAEDRGRKVGPSRPQALKHVLIGKGTIVKTTVKMIAAAVALIAAAPAFAGTTQVVAGNGMTLTQAAQAKFNRDTRTDDQHPVVIARGDASAADTAQLAAIAGVDAEGLTLNQIFVAKINREARGDEKQAAGGSQISMASRNFPAGVPGQLAASAGLTDEAAAGMSLTEIAAAKFARDTDADH